MRISICGPLAESAISKAENVLGVSAKLPGKKVLLIMQQRLTSILMSKMSYLRDQHLIF